MSDLLIRNVPSELAEALRDRAKRNGRSIAAEAIQALRTGLAPSGAAFAARIKAYHASSPASFDVDLALEMLERDRAR